MKNEKIRALFMVMLVIVLLVGCKETPDKSAVVSKADGLSEDLIAAPLKEKETRTIDMPEHWSKTEKKSNDRVTISSNMDMEQLEIGNLPVLEIKNHELSQEELGRLIDYFAKGEELYAPQADTKKMYQRVKDRIDKKEGAYANTLLWTNYQKIAKSLEEAIKLASEKPAPEKQTEIKFKKKLEDTALDAAMSWHSQVDKSNDKDREIFFSADVGKDRLSRIEAECFDPDVGNTSTFKWNTGSNIIELRTIQREIRMNEVSAETGGYTETYRNILNQFADALDQQSFSADEGQKQAQHLLTELKLPEMTLLSSDKVLWFPRGAIPEVTYAIIEDQLWQADLGKAAAGYEYTFTRVVGDLPVKQVNGITTVEAKKSYTSPFPVETVTITVTEDGVKSFSWIGMCEEVATVAENVKLLPFDDIQTFLFEQIFYWYSKHGQPAEDTTVFNYNVTDAKLGYTYVTAFNKQEDAWLVPTWFFEVMESSGPTDDVQDMKVLSFMINAMDGGIIG